MTISKHLAQSIASAMFSNIPMAVTKAYMALYDGDPTQGGVEVSYHGYERQAVDMTAVDNDGKCSNTAVLLFPPNIPAVEGDPVSLVNVTHAALVDNLVGGHVLAPCPLARAKVLDEDDTVAFNIGKVVIQFNTPPYVEPETPIEPETPGV